MRICFRPMLIAAGVLCCLAGAVEGQVKPVVTRRSEFRIPFTFDSQEVSRLGLSEVQLFVSRDGGKTWKHTSSTLPTGQKFRYRATEDGEYQFAVRTLDRDHKLHPSGPLTPGLIVRVDTSQPTVELNVSKRPAGGAAVSWICTDPTLDVQTLRLEYKLGTGSRWLHLPCNKAAAGVVLLPEAAGSLVVRANISDAAGNEGSAQRRWSAASVVGAEAEISAELNVLGTTGTVTEAMFDPPQRATLRQITPPLAPPATPAEPRSLDVIGPFEIPRVAPAVAPGVVAGSLPVPRQEASEQTLDASVPQVINKRRFSLEYGLEGVGSSGISSVEVYITEDGGKKWWRYGSDRDKQSPVVLQVPRDGRYGFVISAKSGAGLGDPPPSPGQEPQSTIIVDRTPPRARFDSITLSEDAKQLDVRWTVEDPNLDDKPIRLEYSGTQNGPWSPMCEWSENNGKLNWQIVPGAPSHIFVRMVARDAAGNAGQLVYPRSILVDVSRPKVRINSIKVSTR